MQLISGNVNDYGNQYVGISKIKKIHQFNLGYLTEKKLKYITQK